MVSDQMLVASIACLIIILIFDLVRIHQISRSLWKSRNKLVTLIRENYRLSRELRSMRLKENYRLSKEKKNNNIEE